jgi:hypothetical protein
MQRLLQSNTMVLPRLRCQDHPLSYDCTSGLALFSCDMAIVYCFRDDYNRVLADGCWATDRGWWKIQRGSHHTHRPHSNSTGNGTVFLGNDRRGGSSHCACASGLPASPKESLTLNASFTMRRQLDQLPLRPRPSSVGDHSLKVGCVQST